MINSRFFRGFLAVATGVSLAGLTGCSNLPGTPKQQGAVVGGLGGAAAGAAIGGSNHRLLGALLGGALGAGGGYVIGANKDRILQKDTTGAKTATQSAQSQPATAQQAASATTADINNDGFVTLDEVVAMKNAGLTDAQMLERMRATGQVFDLTQEQQQYLQDQGVSQQVVNQMQDLNRETRDQLLNQQQQNGVISHPQSHQ